MAFIPIDAKADLSNSKKGKLTPAQHAQLNAWSLAGKTGILNCLDKCSAQQTTIFVQDGDTEATVVFNKGYFVVCGRLVECEQGTTVTIPLPAGGGASFGYIVARFDLSASGESEFTITTKPVAGTLDAEDLNNNPISGKFDFVLYKYAVSTGAFHTVNLYRDHAHNKEYIPAMSTEIADLGKSVEQLVAQLQNEIKAEISDIEERLTALGFNEGSITGISGATLTRMGKYAILSLTNARKTEYTQKLTMSYISKDSFTMQVPDTSGSTQSIEFTAGSTAVYITGATNTNILKAQIGFEVE